MTTLAAINGVSTFSCQSSAHARCKGAWFSFTYMSRVACGCLCHTDLTLFELEGSTP